jgi:hypothetical protein
MGTRGVRTAWFATCVARLVFGITRSFDDLAAAPAIGAQRRAVEIQTAGDGCPRGVGWTVRLFDGGNQFGMSCVERLAYRINLRGFVFVAHHGLTLPAIRRCANARKLLGNIAQEPSSIRTQYEQLEVREGSRGNPRRRAFANVVASHSIRLRNCQRTRIDRARIR